MQTLPVLQLDSEGYLIGETVADESPLEPGVWLYPANTVAASKPLVPDGFRARWGGSAFVVEPLPAPQAPAEPTSEEIIAGYISALDGYFDLVAQVQGFDSRLTLIARAGYNGPFRNKAGQFGEWMDNCYIQAQTIKADVLAGRRTPPPTLEQVLSELPAPPWPLQ